MSEALQSHLAGAFTGYSQGQLFSLDNGLAYQQLSSEYEYSYAYHPVVRIYRQGASLMLAVEGTSGAVQVVPVSVVEQGPIISDFRGFDGHSIFQFQNGHLWQQAEYRYAYHYAYRPHAMVVDGVNGPQLHVDGMSEVIRVRRVR